uniref:Homeobox domain-containing protein n=1 Tax=Panagrolaimus sp. JU765 TaxID=591449 RepID=A0AC34R5C3_9BILA
MFPVRVLVETVRPQHCLGCSHDGQPIVDTYAVVSGQTVLNQLVESVLNALGMAHLVPDSRGLIQVNNWKPLSFENITDNPDEPIANLLKDINSSITLKILTKNSESPNTECIVDLKQKLLSIAVDRQPHLLTSSSGRQARDFIQQILNGDDMQPLSAEQSQALQEWLEQIAKEEDDENKRRSQVSEIPRLERWFKQDPNPPRQKLVSFMNMLNSAAYRKNNSKVTYQQICNWFSNQRAQNRPSTLPSISQPASIPVATQPIDIRNKFGSNGYNSQLDRQSETDRIDGGSESPNGHDDVSEHSISDNDQEMKESLASSPDQPNFDFPASNGNSSPKRSVSPTSQLSALQAMLPNFATVNNLPMATSNQLTQQFANIFSQMGNATFAAHLSKELTSTPATSRDSATPSKSESKANGSNENQREGSTSNTPNVARSRLMFDPLSELPILERWFEENPHPGWMQIEQYTDMLNGLPYRQNYPPISTHNVKIWFKNRRAKCKRLLTNDTGKLGGLNQFLQLGVRDDRVSFRHFYAIKTQDSRHLSASMYNPFHFGKQAFQLSSL